MKTKNNSFYARNSDISFSFPFFFVWFLFLEKFIVIGAMLSIYEAWIYKKKKMKKMKSLREIWLGRA